MASKNLQEENIAKWKWKFFFASYSFYALIDVIVSLVLFSGILIFRISTEKSFNIFLIIFVFVSAALYLIYRGGRVKLYSIAEQDKNQSAVREGQAQAQLLVWKFIGAILFITGSISILWIPFNIDVLYRITDNKFLQMFLILILFVGFLILGYIFWKKGKSP